MTSAQYSLTIRVEIAHRPGMLGKVATAIGLADGMIGSIDLVSIDEDRTLRDITVDASSQEHWAQILESVAAIDGARVVDTTDRTFLLHVGGKIEQHNRVPVKTRDDLSMAYTPGVARVCTAIHEDRAKAFQVADAVAAAVAAEAKAEGAATAHGDEIGFAPGDTADFRAVDAS